MVVVDAGWVVDGVATTPRLGSSELVVQFVASVELTALDLLRVEERAAATVRVVGLGVELSSVDTISLLADVFASGLSLVEGDSAAQAQPVFPTAGPVFGPQSVRASELEHSRVVSTVLGSVARILLETVCFVACPVIANHLLSSLQV